MDRDALDPRPRTLHDLLGNAVTYTVPPFQRDYAWDIIQWSELWDDIIALGPPPEKQHERHYMGYIVLRREDEERKFVIVDGQQRMITLSILARAVADSIEDARISNSLRQSYLYTAGVVEQLPNPRIIPNLLNRSYYRQYLVESNPFPIQIDQNFSNSKMHAAYIFFRTQIAEELADYSDRERLNFFDHQVGDGLLFTVLDVRDDEAAFTIFETLNARGVELSSPDLIRNRLFSILYDADRTKQTLKEMSTRWQETIENLGAGDVISFLRHFPGFTRWGRTSKK